MQQKAAVSSERVLAMEFQTPRPQEAATKIGPGSSSKKEQDAGLREAQFSGLPLLGRKAILSKDIMQPHPDNDAKIKDVEMGDTTLKHASTNSQHLCKLLSLNIFMRPPLIKNNESDHKEDRLKDAFNYLSNFEIVCLQEMFDTLSTRKLRMKLQALSHGFGYSAESQPPSLFGTGQIIDGGLLTLSKFPIVESEFFGFTAGCEIDKIAQKGVLFTKVLLSEGLCNRHLFLFNTHLQSSYDKYYSPKTKLSFLVRFAQVIEMKEFISRCCKKYGFSAKNDFVMLCGDLNIDYYGQHLDLSVYQKAFSKELGFLDQLPEGAKLNEHELAVRYLGASDDGFTVKDLLDSANSHPHPKYTYADAEPDLEGKFVPCETVLTCKEDLLQSMRLDYMLHLTPKSTAAVAAAPQTSVSNAKCQVEKLQVQGRKYTHLSDHYGISFAFNLD